MNYQAYKAAVSRFRKKREAIDKLFVYGTLRNQNNCKLVIGQSFETEPAILFNYRRIHPRNGYPFAVHWRGSKIEGLVLYGITPEALKKIDVYESEGTLYRRKAVRVLLLDDSDQFVNAYVYIGIPEALKPYFQKGIEQDDRIEEFVEQGVNKYLEGREDIGTLAGPESLSLQVRKELLSEETHSLVRQYFHDVGLPPFIIKHELQRANLPSLDWLKYTPKAVPYADQYLELAVKLMIFNQLEERFRHEFRSQVKVHAPYYWHTISALMALKLLVSRYRHVRSAIAQLQVGRYNPEYSYVDYTVAAIFIAEDIYSREWVQEVVAWMQTHRSVGLVPLGAEIEFSEIGGDVISAPEGMDARFDGFYYFYDFDLMRRGWKLGAHVDDHGFLTTGHTRSRGFLELAFGRYRLLGDVSKPATQDPWILSQLIALSIRYLDIRPHSLHLSLQTDGTQPFQRIPDPDYLLCLLILGGDLREDTDGILREMRIYREEISRPDGTVYFSRFNKHHKDPGTNAWASVIEYQFPRSSFDYDYQPLIMALKGLQIAANPYPLHDFPACPHDEWHHELQTQLVQWAAEPSPVSQLTIERFLNLVAQGLEQESRRIGQAPYSDYVERMLRSMEYQLTLRNKRIRQHHDSRQGITDQDYSAVSR